MEVDYNKVKELFATDDLNNHILGTLLYVNNGRGRTHQKLFWLIVNDRNGWKLKMYKNYTNNEITYIMAKNIFGCEFMFKIEHNRLFYQFKFKDAHYIKWNEFDLKNTTNSDHKIYKLFQDTWEDLCEKYCKY